MITHQANLGDSLKLMFERCVSIKLDYGDSWGLITRIIDAEIHNEKEKGCPICYENFEKGYFEDGGCEKYDFPKVQCKRIVWTISSASTINTMVSPYAPFVAILADAK